MGLSERTFTTCGPSKWVSQLQVRMEHISECGHSIFASMLLLMRIMRRRLPSYVMLVLISHATNWKASILPPSVLALPTPASLDVTVGHPGGSPSLALMTLDTW